MKKLLSLILSLMMAICVIPFGEVSASAASKTDTYSVYAQSYYQTSKGKKTKYTVKIVQKDIKNGLKYTSCLYFKIYKAGKLNKTITSQSKTKWFEAPTSVDIIKNDKALSKTKLISYLSTALENITNQTAIEEVVEKLDSKELTEYEFMNFSEKILKKNLPDTKTEINKLINRYGIDTSFAEYVDEIIEQREIICTVYGIGLAAAINWTNKLPEEYRKDVKTDYQKKIDSCTKSMYSIINNYK